NTTARLKKIASRVVVSQLRRRVKKLLAEHTLTIITVTGTIGKTSAKMAIGGLLTELGHKVGYSEDSYNTEVGVPLALFGLKIPDRLSSPNAWRNLLKDIDQKMRDYPYDVVVVEIAEDERAMMTPWVELLKPNISVVTAASAAHMERFESVEQLRDDAVHLASYGRQIYYNADFEMVREVMERRQHSIGYGVKHGAFRFEKIARTKEGHLDAELIIGKERKVVRTQLIAEHSLYALLLAACVAHDLGEPLAKIAQYLSLIPPMKGRLRLLPGVNDSKLLDDTYNSSPTAVMAAIDTLKQIPGRSHIAVLGSMNELGRFSPDLHRQVARYAVQSELDMLVTIGKEAAEYLATEAIEQGMEKSRVKQFRTPYEAGHYLKKHILADDVVLVKGSQNGVFAEETSRILLAPGHHPSHELVRQTPAWKRKKKKSFGI
ncbi:hypothetical protein KBC99_02990, partial [Candidatus Saccharibacteria bacterium]|nr:hypothetical protein [Candidatus Saccharibacteria bacterium]